MRLFAALDIPEDVRATLGALIAKLHGVCKNARWVRVEGLHVTLKFIGEVSADRSRDIKKALAAVQFPAPIPLRFGGIGFFPNSHHPRVIWAGVNAGRGLTALASRVEEALDPLGIAREDHAFSPHLTLARFDSPNKLGDLHSAIAAIGADGPPEFGTTIAKQFHLYQSVLKPGGSEYTRLATFSFVGSKPE
jgi:RNA 2',3'-cyclic 3'-phosphodiesterase